MNPKLDCAVDHRRVDVRAADLNGLDFLEVGEDQRTLCLHFLGRIPRDLTAANVRIEGGRRVRNVQVIGVRIRPADDPEQDDCLEVSVDRPGDFSTYRICIVALDPDGGPDPVPYPGFDPRYACLDFSFKIGCPSELDCKVEPVCPPEPTDQPAISYLAKDYASFRQLLMDRMALLVPEWRERHVPDLAVTLVELLAYVADSLSYYQDAVATEAYLGTARQRISVRRHLRLVDYALSEGNNARAWVFVETEGDDVSLEPGDVAFVTAFAGGPPRGTHLRHDQLPAAGGFEVFEPLVDRPGPLVLRPEHNLIRFHTWGDRDCCLPEGTTSATLQDGPPWGRPAEEESSVYGRGPYQGSGKPDQKPEPEPEPERLLRLAAGDFLLFEQVLGAKTGAAADADPGRRHVVRLTKVTPGVDELYHQPVLEVEWAQADALPFPLCVSSLGPPPGCEWLEPVSVARGNVVLVDHGATGSEPLDPVPEPDPLEGCEGECRPADVDPAFVRYHPDPLQRVPLTFAEPLPTGGEAPASLLIRQDPRRSQPQIFLQALAPGGGAGDEQRWSQRPDMLASEGDDLHFVVEMDDERRAHLRFGDDDLGEAPGPGTAFTATYRVGNGPAGNVGAETISYVVLRQSVSGVVLRPRNPLAAAGGQPPEPTAEAKLVGPGHFRRRLERAVTAEDYATLARRELPAVQRAAAALRWTGSWYEANVAVDQLGRPEAAPELLAEAEVRLERYRRMGHDLRARPAEQVPFLVQLRVCVGAEHLKSHVRAALLDLLGSGRRTGGGLGFFHPDNLTFGQGVHLSPLVAAVHAVDGVDSVEVVRLERLFDGPRGEVEAGVLHLGPFEIARLDNDPGNPEMGQLHLLVEGGR